MNKDLIFRSFYAPVLTAILTVTLLAPTSNSVDMILFSTITTHGKPISLRYWTS